MARQRASDATGRRGSLSRRETTVRRGQTINERPRPRVLIRNFGTPEDDAAVAAIVAEIAPTVDTVRWPEEKDLFEYDVVITTHPYASLAPATHPDADKHWTSETLPDWWKWTQELPAHISVLFFPSVGMHGLIDFCPAGGEGTAAPDIALLSETRVVGSHVTYVQGLPEDVDELVKRHAAPSAQERDRHVTFDRRVTIDGSDQPSSLQMRPLLLGPRDAVLAFTYQRSVEASAWVIPLDLVGDLKAWVIAALREWHDLYPRRFPPVPNWRTNGWTTPAEDDLTTQIHLLEESFEEAQRDFEKRRAEMTVALTEAATDVDAYERALLTGTGEPLEQVVARALRELGFTVQEMDEVWPTDARREDFRITDPDDTGWIAVGEAKGFRKGVSETGLQSLSRWVTFYAVEVGATPSAQWYIANQFLLEDPATRPTPLHGRDDAVAAFAESNDLLIDTQLLFRLVVTSQRDPSIKPRVRALLRSSRGRLSADALLNDLGPPTDDAA